MGNKSGLQIKMQTGCCTQFRLPDFMFHQLFVGFWVGGFVADFQHYMHLDELWTELWRKEMTEWFLETNSWKWESQAVTEPS